jgi:hypothetical protein
MLLLPSAPESTIKTNMITMVMFPLISESTAVTTTLLQACTVCDLTMLVVIALLQPTHRASTAQEVNVQHMYEGQ